MEKKIQETFKDLVGRVYLQDLKSSELGFKPPAFMRLQFKFIKARLPVANTELILAIPQQQLSPASLERQFKLMSQMMEGLIFVFEKLSTRERERLVRRRIQFMIPGRFFYAPTLGLLGPVPTFSETWNQMLSKKKLSGWAETLLIGRLLDASFENATGVELADRYKTSTMTISRALRELENLELCNVVNDRTRKKVIFGTTQNLWQKSREILESPVTDTIGLIDLPEEKLLMAGDSALAYYSMLQASDSKVYAISKRQFSQRMQKQDHLMPSPLEGRFTLELWKRDPSALSKDNYIDPLSLYLSLRDSPDERIQIELENLLVKIGLEIKNGG